MTRLIQWGHKPSKNSKHLKNNAFRQQSACEDMKRRTPCAPVKPQPLASTAPTTPSPPRETADSCTILLAFKFLPRFMTRLIQWGHKPSKNSKYVENHIFRGPVALVGAYSPFPAPPTPLLCASKKD